MKLMQVSGTWILNWPDGVVLHGESPQRGRSGYVVDLDAPLEATFFCKGQEYKLEPAARGASATEITHSRARQLVKDAARTMPVREPEKVGGQLPKVDMPAVDKPTKPPPMVIGLGPPIDGRGKVAGGK